MPPIDVLPLFSILDQKLITLLQSLTPDDWQRPTLARRWTVKDIAAHLLDGNLRTLSMLRDGYFGEAPGEINSYDDLLGFLNRLNADWVMAMRRLSPSILIDLLDQSGREYTDFLATLDLQAPAAFAVAWAGESESANWFHVAREYTEKWHHQQQIRAAVGQADELLTPELFRPFIETFMRGLPHAYRDVAAPPGAVVQVRVTTASGGTWQLVKGAVGWQLQPAADDTFAAEAVLTPETAWRLFTKGIDPATAEARSELRGDLELARAALRMVAVMA